MLSVSQRRHHVRLERSWVGVLVEPSEDRFIDVADEEQGGSVCRMIAYTFARCNKVSLDFPCLLVITLSQITVEGRYLIHFVLRHVHAEHTIATQAHLYK